MATSIDPRPSRVFDALSDALADDVANMTGGASIDRRAAVAVDVLSNTRCDATRAR